VASSENLTRDAIAKLKMDYRSTNVMQMDDPVATQKLENQGL
jgi:hypothetical protein